MPVGISPGARPDRPFDSASEGPCREARPGNPEPPANRLAERSGLLRGIQTWRGRGRSIGADDLNRAARPRASAMSECVWAGYPPSETRPAPCGSASRRLRRRRAGTQANPRTALLAKPQRRLRLRALPAPGIVERLPPIVSPKPPTKTISGPAGPRRHGPGRILDGKKTGGLPPAVCPAGRRPPRNSVPIVPWGVIPGSPTRWEPASRRNRVL